MVRRMERVAAHREEEVGAELEWQTGRFADGFAPRRPALDRQDTTAATSWVSPTALQSRFQVPNLANVI